LPIADRARPQWFDHEWTRPTDDHPPAHVRNFRCWSRWCSRVAWAARLVRWVASS